MAKPELIACVVVYNHACADSLTCRGLRGAPARVLIADNSTADYGNAAFCAAEGWEYLPMGGNIGLSRAYNRVLDALTVPDDALIIWMDDDTELGGEYFEALQALALAQPETDIFAPIVYGRDGVIYSPNERRFFQNRFLKSEAEVPAQERFNAINSCLAVRARFYRGYRYDEDLFMDSVDQKFCADACGRGARFAVLPVTLVQDFFQRSEGLTAERVWRRYRIRIHDFLLYANDGAVHRWLGFGKVCAWGVQMGAKCRSPRLAAKMFGFGLSCTLKLSLGKTLPRIEG